MKNTTVHKCLIIWLFGVNLGDFWFYPIYNI